MCAPLSKIPIKHVRSWSPTLLHGPGIWEDTSWIGGTAAWHCQDDHVSVRSIRRHPVQCIHSTYVLTGAFLQLTLLVGALRLDGDLSKKSKKSEWGGCATASAQEQRAEKVCSVEVLDVSSSWKTAGLIRAWLGDWKLEMQTSDQQREPGLNRNQKKLRLPNSHK